MAVNDKTTQHTPGPWVALPEDEGIRGEPSPVFADAAPEGDKLVAECYGSNHQANACLIKEAPNMLAELVRLEEHARLYGGVPKSADKLWKRVQDLIQRATNER
jgi:hypothetical protein